MTAPVDISPARLKPIAEAVQEILARHIGDQCQCDGLGAASYGIARLIAKREAAETERCAAIVQRARFGEIDRDFRSIVSRIESHTPADQD